MLLWLVAQGRCAASYMQEEEPRFSLQPAIQRHVVTVSKHTLHTETLRTEATTVQPTVRTQPEPASQASKQDSAS